MTSPADTDFATAESAKQPTDRSSPLAPGRVAVIIPTYNRGTLVLETLRRIYACDPQPDEIWIHVDAADGKLEADIARAYPDVHLLTSKTRLGPGGGRHRCLMACRADYAVSFDDDSYPIDPDFFAVVRALFAEHPRTAVLEAEIWQRDQDAITRSDEWQRLSSYTGCGHAIRVDVYRSVPGYLVAPVPYNIEEIDVALQLFNENWEIGKTGALRVYHDTVLKHHRSTEMIAGMISNVALFAFINYPVILWPYGLLQIANAIVFRAKEGRGRGLLAGLGLIPVKCYRHRHVRRPLPASTIIRYLRAR